MNGTGRSGSCSHSSAGDRRPVAGTSTEAAVAEARVGAAVAVQVPDPLGAPRRRPPGQIEPLVGAHQEHAHRRDRLGWGARPRTISSRKPVMIAFKVDHRIVAEVDVAELAVRVHLVAPRAHQQALPGPARGRHRGEVRGGPDFLIVIPARDVQHGHVDLRDAVLVAQRLPAVVKRLMAAFLAPERGMKAGGVVEVDERPVPVDLHPVDGAPCTAGPAVGHPVPVHVHRPGHAGRVLDERIGRGDEHDHRSPAPAAGAAP